MADMSENVASKVVLGPSCWIKGEMHLDGDLQLHGEYQGSLHVAGTLDIRATASIQGLARAGAVRVAGKVDGDLVGEQGIAVLEGSSVSGRLFATRLLAVKGATIRAQVCIGPDAMAQAPGKPVPADVHVDPVAVQEEDMEEIISQSPPAVSAMAMTQAEEEFITDEQPTQTQQEPAISVAAALDDADEPDGPASSGQMPEPMDDAADIETVPTSIRAVLQRRPRMSNLAAHSRRTA